MLNRYPFVTFSYWMQIRFVFDLVCHRRQRCNQRFSSSSPFSLNSCITQSSCRPESTPRLVCFTLFRIRGQSPKILSKWLSIKYIYGNNAHLCGNDWLLSIVLSTSRPPKASVHPILIFSNNPWSTKRPLDKISNTFSFGEWAFNFFNR